MATHSSVLAWRIPGMWKPGGLPSMGSHRVRHAKGHVHFPGQAAPGSSACLLNTSHAQGTGLGPTYPLGMADIVPRAHGNFKGPRKCFSFHFV